MTPFFGVQSFRNFYDNMPYGGQGGMEWITKRGVFATPMVIKMLPVRDMALPTKNEYNDFDALVYNIRTSLPIGAKVKAIQVVENRAVSGFVGDVKFDYDKRRVRIFVREGDNNRVVEVYPESVYREIDIRESKSYVMNLSEFVEKTNED
jgi:hypothetical protein